MTEVTVDVRDDPKLSQLSAVSMRGRCIKAHVTIATLALLVERIAEIRTGDTWRNLADPLDPKVVAYDRSASRATSGTGRHRAHGRGLRSRRRPASSMSTRERAARTLPGNLGAVIGVLRIAQGQRPPAV